MRLTYWACACTLLVGSCLYTGAIANTRLPDAFLPETLADRLPTNANRLRSLACLLDQISASANTQGQLRTAIDLIRTSTSAASLRQNLQDLRPVVARDELRRNRSLSRQQPAGWQNRGRGLRQTLQGKTNSGRTRGPQTTSPTTNFQSSNGFGGSSNTNTLAGVSWLTATGATNSPSAERQLWVRAMQNRSEQDDRGDLEGFDADSQLFEIGADWQHGNLNFGASASRESGDVDSQRLGSDAMDSNAVSVNAGVTHGGHFFSATAAWQGGNTERQRILPIRTPGGDRTFFLNADIDTTQLSMELSWATSWNPTQEFSVLPYAGITYAILTTDNYQELGAGNLGLNVATDDVTQVVGRLGLSGTYALFAGNWLVAPSAQVGFEHDFRADAIQTNSQFGETGFTFASRGFEVEENRWHFGLGVTFLHLNGFAASLNLNSQRKDDYRATSVAISLQTQF